MANKRIYHDIITCSVKDTARMEKLADSSKIVALKDLKFGLHVVVVISWIQQKFRLQSSDIGKLMKEDPLKRATAKKVWNLAVEATVKGDKTAVLGGNIILPKGESIKLYEVEKALQLLNPKHPIRVLLSSICSKHFTVNYLDVKGLEDLVKLIDFPIPSISALIKSLGYHYLIENPYIQDGIVIGRTENDDHQVCILYSGTKFKVLPFNSFMFLASQQALTVPLSNYEACQLEVYTNHICKEH